MKRGYYSFWIILVLYLLSFLNPLMVNNKALAVRYDAALHFPAFGRFYPKDFFGQEGYGEADYRSLRETLKGNTPGWVIMPFYPYSPTEHNLEELLRSGKTAPSGPDRRHWLGTDNRGRDVFARLAYGFNISLTFALIVTFFPSSSASSSDPPWAISEGRWISWDRGSSRSSRASPSSTPSCC